MARKYPVTPLCNQSSNVLTNTIWKFLHGHCVPDSCKYCDKRFLNEDCLDLKYLKRILTEAPCHARIMIYQQLSEILNAMCAEEHEQNRIFELLFLNRWLFERNDFMFEYVSYEDMEDLYLVSRFANSIDRINFHRSSFNNGNQSLLNLNCLKKNLRLTTNLQFLIFHFAINTDLLKFIGRYCKNLKTVNGKISKDDFSPDVYRCLLYKDETMTEKNDCCQTLQEIDFEIQFPESEGDVAERKQRYQFIRSVTVESLNILFNAVPNLRTVGDTFDLRWLLYSILNPETGPAINIEFLKLKSLTNEMMRRIKLYCPRLKLFYLKKCPEKEILQTLNSISSLTNIILAKVGGDSFIYDGILSSKFSKLVSLAMFGKFNQLNLSVFSKTLENLEILSTGTFESVLWDGRTYFRCLQEFAVLIEEPQQPFNPYWFQCFSGTIKQLVVFSDDIIFCRKSLSVLFECNFPKLEDLTLRQFPFDIELLTDIIMCCPSLTEIGQVINALPAEVESFNDYLKNLNIDCAVNLLPDE